MSEFRDIYRFDLRVKLNLGSSISMVENLDRVLRKTIASLDAFSASLMQINVQAMKTNLGVLAAQFAAVGAAASGAQAAMSGAVGGPRRRGRGQPSMVPMVIPPPRFGPIPLAGGRGVFQGPGGLIRRPPFRSFGGVIDISPISARTVPGPRPRIPPGGGGGGGGGLISARGLGTFGLISGAFMAERAIQSALVSQAQFDRAIARTGAVAQATGKDLDAFRMAARRVGLTTTVSMTEAASALQLFAQAGFSSRDAIEALDATVLLAQAGFVDIDTATNVAINTMKQFNKRPEDLSRIVDVMAHVVNKSKISMEELSASLEFTGSIAGVTGITFEETAAALGILADAGLSGTKAGTALRQIMSDLAAPTERAKDILAHYGLTANEVSPVSNTLVDIFAKFERRGLKAADVFRLFDIRAATGAAGIQTLNSGFANLTEELKTVEGEAERVREKALDNLADSAVRLRNTLSTVVEKGWEPFRISLKGIFGDIADFISRNGEGFSKFVESITGLSAGVAAGLIYPPLIGPAGIAGAVSPFVSSVEVPPQGIIGTPIVSEESIQRIIAESRGLGLPPVAREGARVPGPLGAEVQGPPRPDTRTEMEKLDDAIRLASIRTKDFNAKIDLARVSLKGAIDVGVIGFKDLGQFSTSVFEDLRLATKQFAASAIDVGAAWRGMFGDIKDAFAGLFEGMLKGMNKMKDLLKSFRRDIVAAIRRTVADVMAQVAVRNVLGMIFGFGGAPGGAPGTAGAGGTPAGAALGGAASGLGMAAGFGGLGLLGGGAGAVGPALSLGATASLAGMGGLGGTPLGAVAGITGIGAGAATLMQAQRGNVGGALAAGALSGAALGSIIPGVGTLIGAGVGAAVGGLGGLFGRSKRDKARRRAKRQAAAAASAAEAARAQQRIQAGKQLQATFGGGLLAPEAAALLGPILSGGIDEAELQQLEAGAMAGGAPPGAIGGEGALGQTNNINAPVSASFFIRSQMDLQQAARTLGQMVAQSIPSGSVGPVP